MVVKSFVFYYQRVILKVRELWLSGFGSGSAKLILFQEMPYFRSVLVLVYSVMIGVNPVQNKH